MSHVHEALRRAARQESNRSSQAKFSAGTATISARPAPDIVDAPAVEDFEDLIRNAKSAPFQPLSESLLVNPSKPQETPGEEFRTLRTKLNHLQTLQPLRSLVVTSASPAEAKAF